MKKWLIAATVAVAVAVGLSGCGGGSPEPQDVTGTWQYSKDGIGFEATVTEDNIEIELTLDDTTGLYWTGTFESSLTEGQKVVSKADTEALDASLYGSGDSTKEFTYEDGHLTYKFEIMGTTTKIYLNKN